jgi:hypothetical protein
VDRLVADSPLGKSGVKVFKQDMFQRPIVAAPDIMAPVKACTLQDHGLHCSLKDLGFSYGAVVNFLTAEGDYIGGVDGMPTNKVFVNNACPLEYCGSVDHYKQTYDHFSCKCPRGDSSVA